MLKLATVIVLLAVAPACGGQDRADDASATLDDNDGPEAGGCPTDAAAAGLNDGETTGGASASASECRDETLDYGECGAACTDESPQLK